MSSALVVQGTNLGVAYRRYLHKVVTLKEAFTRRFKGSRYEQFWALREVDFSVRRGEIFGIVGPNGSGKSTLLKAITRVLEPTEGTIVAHGKIAPLIEIGAGFNSELTGRENVYLNGSILGFSRKQMDLKLPGIIEFSGLADFIDSPVRNYSSGMVVRLGFAIATDVDPDILIMDEVFSVGDAEFSKKSLKRIESLMTSAATVIIVSHNLDMIQRYCNRGLLLWQGRAVKSGSAEEVVAEYQNRIKELG